VKRTFTGEPGSSAASTSGARKWIVRSTVGTGTGTGMRTNAAGHQASAYMASAGASSGRSSRRRIQPPVTASSAGGSTNGIGPSDGRRSKNSTIGKPGGIQSSGSSSPNGVSSMAGVSKLTSRSYGPPSAARAMTRVRPSCTSRALTLVSVRPERSTVTSTAAGPGLGVER
jgi:hypothetical protein